MAVECNCSNQDTQYSQILQEIFADYKGREQELIPLLQEAQEEIGYLPKDVLYEIGLFLGISYSRIYGVATFYSQFHLQPRGENIIRICMGTACHVRGGERVLEAVEEELGIKAGETTEDLKFTLESVACIGACGLAPVMMVNDNTHGRLTPEKVPGVLEEYE